MWSMLGERNVDMCHWESFGKGWFGDAISHLKLKELCEVREITAGYGELPDLGSVSAPAPSLARVSLAYGSSLASFLSAARGCFNSVLFLGTDQPGPRHLLHVEWHHRRCV